MASRSVARPSIAIVSPVPVTVMTAGTRRSSSDSIRGRNVRVLFGESRLATDCWRRGKSGSQGRLMVVNPHAVGRFCRQVSADKQTRRDKIGYLGNNVAGVGRFSMQGSITMSSISDKQLGGTTSRTTWKDGKQ